MSTFDIQQIINEYGKGNLLGSSSEPVLLKSSIAAITAAKGTMKKIQGEVTWQTISPPVEAILIKDLSPEDAHIQSWGWVDCEALAKCIQEHFTRQGKVWPEDGVLRNDSVFDHYAHLDVDQDGKPVYTWANASGVTIKGKPPFASEWSAPFKIPRRVCKGILSLVNQGILRVTVERIPIAAPNHYFHIGHGADGMKFEILNGGRGDGSYRAVKWRPLLTDEPTSTPVT